MTFLLLSCRREPTIDAQFVSDLFSDMELNTDHIFINHVDHSNGNQIDRIEMLDQSNSERIRIHIIDSIKNYDYQILITPDYIYDTRTMVKSPNHYDQDENGRIEAIYHYTTLIDFNQINLSEYYELAQKLHQRTFNVSRITNTLRGEYPTNRHDSYREFIEFKIIEDQLFEVHYRIEDDFQSTKKESNYIAGMHFYFSDQKISEFPPLDTFFEE